MTGKMMPSNEHQSVASHAEIISPTAARRNGERLFASQFDIVQSPCELLDHDDSICTIFDRKPTQRKMIRDTKNIKVSFGNYKSQLLGPRNDVDHRVEKSDRLNLYEIENEYLEQSHRLSLLE